MSTQGKAIINSYTDGMAMDVLLTKQSNTTYRYARNAILGDSISLGYGLSNEQSVELAATVGAAIVGHLFVERLNSSIIFAEGDIIGYFDHDMETYKEVARASEFGCTWGFNQCEWIDAEYKSMQPCDELYTYFSSNCTYYRINLSELLNPTRKKALVAAVKAGNSSKTNCGYSCDYFKLMNCVCSPRTTSSVSENSGHSLESGVYKFAFQLEDNEGNTTNWGEVSQPIYVGSKTNQAGEITSASINVNLTGLDCRYDVVNIAVINGYGRAEIVASRQYSTDGITFTYYGQKGRAIDLEEIITKGKKYLRGRSLEQKDSRLFLYNIRQEKNPNMQRRVFESARLSFITIQTSAKLAERYNLRSLQRGENYMFGIVYKYCDNTFSPVFLMSPEGSCGGGSSYSGGSATPASGKEERYERKRGNTRTGCKANCGCSSSSCGGGGGSGGSGGGGAGGGGNTPKGEEVELRTEVDPWDTVLPNWENSARCNDCHPPVCCQTDDEGNVTVVALEGSDNCEGCHEDEDAIAADGPDLEKAFVDHTDQLTYWAWDTSQKPTSGNIIETAQNLIDAVNNAEVVERKKAEYKISTKLNGPGEGEPPLPTNNTEATIPPSAPTNTQNPDGQVATDTDNVGGNESDTDPDILTTKPKPPVPTEPVKDLSTPPAGIPWGDYHHNITGKADLDGEIKVVECWDPKPVPTQNLYPDSKDCNGENIYGGKANSHVMLFGTPTGAESPIAQPTSKGVPNRFSPAADPYYTADPRHLGIQVTGVPLPDNDEDWFPKPLCPNEPYRIVMVERDHINATIQANCLATSCYLAPSGDQTLYYARHGMCSKDKCDIHILNGDSHKVDDGGAAGGYNLHGLDTNIGKVGLSGTKLLKNAQVNALGYRYGLYAEGKKPNDRLNGNRVDQRGARQMLNANLFAPQGGEFPIEGISYVAADEKNLPVTGVENAVCNGYRESSVFVKVGGSLGPEEDNSFKMDTMDHEVPISDAHGWNVSVKREIPDQYGAVPGMKFIDTGVRANGRGPAVKGFAGDVFIGPYSIKRTGYVSDKVGNLFNTSKHPTCERDRTVCDAPDDLILQNLDVNFYPTRFPKSGDLCDARNWAGGYQDRRALEVSADGPPDYDFYYPKVQKTLIVTWLESRINPWKRATGTGDQTVSGLAYYPRLQGMHIDSHILRDHPWEESFINRFYYRVEQPSPAQLLKKFIYRNVMEILLPAASLYAASTKQLPTDITSYFYVLPGLMAYWRLMKDVVTREDYLNKMVGISDCKIDDEGGEVENHITQFEDNYHDYNSQFSAMTSENYYKAMPLNYNTCDCSRCLTGDTEIFKSDLSRVEIKDIKVGDEVLSFDFDKNEYVNKKVTKFWNRGNQKVYRIHFRNGAHVDATEQHQWFVKIRKKSGVHVVTTKDLIESPKQKYTLMYANNLKTLGADFMTPEEAYILGIYIAEGNKYGKGIFISQFKTATRDKIRDILGKTEFIWKEITNGFYVSNLMAQHDVFMDCGQLAENKRIPDYVFTLNKLALSMLRDGLVDGDGSNFESSVDKNGYNIAEKYYFYTSSHTLEYDFRVLGAILDRPGITYKNVRSGFGSTKVQCTTHCSTKNRLREGKLFIRKIEEIEEFQPTYDIEVEDTHAFVLSNSGAISHNCVDYETTNEIYFSKKQLAGSQIDAYKNFQSLAYNEMGVDGGKIRKLFKWNGDFFAHTTDAIYLIKYSGITQQTSRGLTIAGAGEMVLEPTAIFEGITEGYAGIQDPNSSIVTPYGYFFIDREAKRLYRFDGKTPHEVTSKDVYSFFKEHIGFCNIGSCHDEKNEGSTYYSLGWDNRYNRLLITKKSINKGESMTMSYYPLLGQGGKFVSFHDYLPQSYMWDRDKLFSTTGGKIYKHNIKDRYQEVYGQKVPFEVEFVANAGNGEWFTHKWTQIHTEAERGDLKGLDITFEKMSARNFTQGTGTLPFKLFSDNKDSVQRPLDKIEENGQFLLQGVRRRYTFNELLDYTLPNCQNKPLTLLSGCAWYPKINESIYDCGAVNDSQFMNKRLKDDHLVYRLTYNGDNQTKLRLLDVKTFVDPIDPA